MIFQKLFTAFSEIVVELLNHCDLDPNTRTVLSSNISSISKVLLDTDCASPKPSPKRKIAKPSTRRADLGVAGPSRETRSKSKNNNKPQDVIVPEPALKKAPNASKPKPTQDIEQNSELEALVGVEPTAEQLENELVALGRPKSLFLSGLPPATTDKAIKNHILKKLPGFQIDSITISKMTTKGNYSSFVVNMGTDENLFNMLNSTELWPQGTIVHEFKKNNGKNNLFRRPRYRN